MQTSGDGHSPPDETSAEEIGMLSVLRRRPGVTGVELDGETVLLDHDTGDTHVLSPTATVVWGCLDGTGTLAEIVDDLAEAFGAERDVVARDVLNLVRELGRQGLLAGVARGPAEQGGAGGGHAGHSH